MALADVLSAMREIILDAPALPLESSERERMFEGRFPALSKHEREDLARIDPDRFSVYTTSIFQSEKGILENHMPLSFALVKQHWFQAYNRKFVGRYLTQQLHQRYPWDSQSPQKLIDNFASWIESDCPELSMLRPDLAAIASIERFSYQLKRAPDPVRRTGQHVLTLEELPNITVAELLQAKILFADPLHLLRLPCNVLPVRIAYQENSSQIPELIGALQTTFLAGTRAKNNAILWLEIPGKLFNYMQDSLSTPGTVGDLAQVLIDENDAADEQSAFKCLMQQLSLLISYQIMELELTPLRPLQEQRQPSQVLQTGNSAG